MPLKRTILTIGVLAGTTIGAGMFALPYVASRVGLVPFFAYLVVLGVFVAGAHYLYWLVLEKTGKSDNLVGFARTYLGKNIARIAFVAIVFGLALTLSIYILLGARFLGRVLPLQPDLALILFWLAVSIPLAFQLRRLVRVELVVTGLMILGLLAIVFARPFSLQALPAFTHHDFFFAFGPVLFALAGWTALEPMWRSHNVAVHPLRRPFIMLGLGTLFCGALYALFVVGIASVSTTLAPDVFVGLTFLPPWYLAVLLLLGLCAIVTSYLPMSLEVKKGLTTGLKWPPSLAISAVLFTPYIIVLLGLDNILVLIDLVGGIFLAIQYLIILFVARRVLQLHGVRRFALDVIAAVFFLAIAYQFYYLLV